MTKETILNNMISNIDEEQLSLFLYLINQLEVGKTIKIKNIDISKVATGVFTLVPSMDSIDLSSLVERV